MKVVFHFSLLCCALYLWVGSGGNAVAAPDGNNGSTSADVGKSIYEARCAPCHGINGRGDGGPAAVLNPRPRNFTSGLFKFRSTESGSLPTDEDLVATVKKGLHGTAMADWEPFLKGDSLKAVVNYVKTFSPRFQSEKPQIVRVGQAIVSSVASVAAGKKVYAKLQCGDCHGSDGTGTDAVSKDFKDNWDFDTNAANLTEPWTFRGGAAARDIYMRFRTGIDGTPMPSYAGTASDKEMWDLANYVVSLGRKPVWKMNEAEVKEFYASLDRRAKADPVQRGKYLVQSFGCAGCHSVYSDDLRIVEGTQLSGGLTFDLYPFGKFTSVNLTSDKETGLGSWTDQEIKRAITQGISRDGRKSLPFPMPWTTLATLSEDDQNAIVAYLRTVPAIHHKIPDPDKPNIFAYLWGKFRMLILHEQLPSPATPMQESGIDQKSTSHNSSGSTRNIADRTDRVMEARP